MPLLDLGTLLRETCMKWMLVVVTAAVLAVGLYASGPAPGVAPSKPGAILVDYPSEGSLFPPDIIAPTFQWRDAELAAAAWRIDVIFADRSRSIEIWSQGEKMQLGELDTSLSGYVPPTLTPEQQAAHVWKPDPKTWAEIKKHSVKGPATVTFTGFRAESVGEPVSQGTVNIRTSTDPVGAPIFYRDVPLIPTPPEQGERGVIKPLPDSVLPKIKWRLRYISGTENKS